MPNPPKDENSPAAPAASVQQEPLSAAHPDQSWEYKASFRIAQVLNKSTAHYDVLNIMNIFHDFRVKEELKTYPAVPRTQGRQGKIFKGWIAFGCGKHPRNSQGGTRYDIDCLDCQEQPKAAWFEGEQPIPPLAQARTQTAPRPNLELISAAICKEVYGPYMATVDAEHREIAVNGIVKILEPFFTALPEAQPTPTKKENA